ncbi:M1 family metallopeptidase [Marininema halotolerans]|uniref:Peptidase family M1 n=1 Tax=Marininema halotolerans TaxID=1155944 RepID=A0A1I6SXY5_9BACL|nr:M1 family metallopeptidase [Marininema halotolerans]SFS81742.1 Peptidase family M1 [Marininema halotolerans]
MLRRIVSLVIMIALVIGMVPVSERAIAADQNVSKERPKYIIDAKYDDQQQMITGHLVLKLPVKPQEKLDKLVFRLYPNAFRDWKWGTKSRPSAPGWLTVNHVRVNGEKVAAETKETVLHVPVSKSLAAGKTAQITMDYQLKMPKGGTRLNVYGNTAFLAQWYPMLAVKDAAGWHEEPYTTTGDPFYTQMSDFKVTFHVPQGYHLITSGSDPDGDSKGPVTIEQSNIRDFAAVISKDYERVQGKSEKGVKVNLWYLKGMEDVSQELHDAAVSAMDFFGKHFGQYPYKEVDVVLGETGYGIAGMEYPGLVTSVAKVPTQKGDTPAINVVAHELAHQWWYGVVGNDQVKEPWLDEGLTTFSEFLFMHDQMGENERDFLTKVAERSDEVYKTKGVTSVESLDKYSDPIYALMVYARPAAMMWSLMDKLGREKVMRILSTYYQRYQFRTATTHDFIQTANQVAGEDLTDFFDHWLYFKGTLAKDESKKHHHP